MQKELNVYQDKRGLFEEIYKGRWGQVSVMVIKQNQLRGGHYHKSLEAEVFLVVAGECKVSLSGGIEKEIVLRKGESVSITPGVIHTFYNGRNDSCVLLIWRPTIFDRGAPDTYLPDRPDGNNLICKD